MATWLGPWQVPSHAHHCQTCGHPLTAICMACRGRKGGQAKSARKTKAVGANGAATQWVQGIKRLTGIVEQPTGRVETINVRIWPRPGGKDDA